MSADTDRKFADFNSRLAHLLRLCEVTSSYPERGTVRVRISDARTGEAPLISGELAVLHQRTGTDKSYWLPDVGEHVACLFLPFGRESGVVLGGLYSSADPVPVASRDKAHLRWADGTILEYDRAEHKLTGNVAGEIDLSCTGDARIDAGGDIDAAAAGEARVQATAVTVTAETITLNAEQIGLLGGLSASGPGGMHGQETKRCDTDHEGDYMLSGTLRVTRIEAVDLVVENPIEGTLYGTGEGGGE